MGRQKLEVFVINLGRRPDRLDAMTKMLNELGIEFKRISAIDGKSYDVWKETTRLKMAFYNYLRLPSKGMIACYLSHRLAWEVVARHQLKQAMIFEDDVVPVNFDHAILDLDLEALGLEQLRLEELGVAVHKPLPTKKFSMPILGRQAIGTPTYGAGCYILTLEGAKRMLRAGKFWFNNDHHDMWERVIGLRTAVLRPTMFHQADPISDTDTHHPVNELLPTILKEFLFGPRPTLGAGALRIHRWVKGAARDIQGKVLYYSGVPLRRALLFYALKKGEKLQGNISDPYPSLD